MSEPDCTHPLVRGWRFEDGQAAPMWSCADCGRRFEPVAPQQRHNPEPQPLPTQDTK
jgi:hypothetical protein